MKNKIILGAAIIFASFCAFAQQATAQSEQPQGRQRPTVEERAKRQADKINAAAQLSPDQYTKVLDILKNFTAQKDALRTPGTPPSDDLKAKFKALNEQEEVQLKTVLTPAQFGKMKAARSERPAPPKGE